MAPSSHCSLLTTTIHVVLLVMCNLLRKALRRRTRQKRQWTPLVAACSDEGANAGRETQTRSLPYTRACFSLDDSTAFKYCYAPSEFIFLTKFAQELKTSGTDLKT